MRLYGNPTGTDAVLGGMDLLVVALAVIAVALAFYVGLRAYTRRQADRRHKPADID